MADMTMRGGCIRGQADGLDAVYRGGYRAGIEPRASGVIQHRSLEVAMAMRESARRGSVPVRLPLEDRSLTLMPQRYRWDNKKLLHGEEWYAEQIGNATRW